MFGIGPAEFVIIAVLALILFSPRELPGILRSAAKFWGQLRNTADEFKDAIMNEEGLEEIRDVVKSTQADLRHAESTARRELMKARMEVQRAQKKLLDSTRATEAAVRRELDEVKAGAEATTPAADPVAPASATAPVPAAESTAAAAPPTELAPAAATRPLVAAPPPVPPPPKIASSGGAS